MEDKKTCIICGRLFYKKPSHSRKYWKTKKFCSLLCCGKSKVGLKFSLKTREKMSESRIGKNNPNYGKHPSEETLRKMKESHVGQKGELAGNWKGGITSLNHLIRNSPKYINWRTQVFGRDNFTCQECGRRGSWLEVHHIKRFNDIMKENRITTFEVAMECKELWNLNNGITLCEDCHKKETFD